MLAKFNDSPFLEDLATKFDQRVHVATSPFDGGIQTSIIDTFRAGNIATEPLTPRREQVIHKTEVKAHVAH